MKNSRLDLAEALAHDATDKRIDILRRIGNAGSISEAARAVGVSYKAAWQALETLSNLAGTPLLAKAVGGRGGGGALLTDAGKQVLRAADLLGAARADVFARLARETGVDWAAASMAVSGLRTSMRNQLPCTVLALKMRAATVRVELGLADQTSVFSRITRESAELLGLQPGRSVIALCKATAVEIASEIAPLEGRNLLHGRVSRASRSANGGEMSLVLTGGLQLVGFSAADHGLKSSASAMASVDESGVVIAVR